MGLGSGSRTQNGSYYGNLSRLLFKFHVYERQSEKADMRFRIATIATLLAGFLCLTGGNASADETPWPTKSWQVDRKSVV